MSFFKFTIKNKEQYVVNFLFPPPNTLKIKTLIILTGYAKTISGMYVSLNTLVCGTFSSQILNIYLLNMCMDIGLNEKEIFNWLPGVHDTAGIYCSLSLSTVFLFPLFCFWIKDQDKGIAHYLWSNKGIFIGK